MKRLLLLVLCVAIIASVAIAVVNTVSAQDQPAVQECSWGQVKCCYGSNPCTNECCPRPKDEG